ncbi:MAG: nitroreductase family protein [bacterium]
MRSLNVDEIDAVERRRPDHEVHPLLVARWSPRAMTGEDLTEEELLSLFEAARWAPSSYNAQPWRFLYARRGSADWERFLDLLGVANRTWAKDAAALIVVVSRKNFERNGKPARTHSFDCGAAWQNLALQGTAMELVVHGMQGFDYDAARRTLEIPDEFEVEAMVAVGRPGSAEDLPEKLQEREEPSDRKPVEQIAFEGRMP